MELKAPPARNDPNTGSLAPGVRRRVKKKTLLVKIVKININTEEEVCVM